MGARVREREGASHLSTHRTAKTPGTEREITFDEIGHVASDRSLALFLAVTLTSLGLLCRTIVALPVRLNFFPKWPRSLSPLNTAPPPFLLDFFLDDSVRFLLYATRSCEVARPSLE